MYQPLLHILVFLPLRNRPYNIFQNSTPSSNSTWLISHSISIFTRINEGCLSFLSEFSRWKLPPHLQNTFSGYADAKRDCTDFNILLSADAYLCTCSIDASQQWWCPDHQHFNFHSPRWRQHPRRLLYRKGQATPLSLWKLQHLVLYIKGKEKRECELGTPF